MEEQNLSLRKDSSTKLDSIEIEEGVGSVAKNEEDGLHWERVTMTSLERKGRIHGVMILHGVSGKAERGRLTCVIGPSGAGKVGCSLCDC